MMSFFNNLLFSHSQETDFVSRNDRFEQLAETVTDAVLNLSSAWKKSQGGEVAPCGTTRFLDTGLNNLSFHIHEWCVRALVFVALFCSFCKRDGNIITEFRVGFRGIGFKVIGLTLGLEIGMYCAAC